MKPHPAIVLLVGPPGVGKSTFARALHDRTGIEVLESDAVRRSMFREPGYSKSESKQVFDAVHAATNECLARGSAVIVDATNLIEAERAVIYRIAERTGRRSVVVRITAPAALVRKRLTARIVGSGALPAGVDVFEKMRRIRQPIARPHFVVDTTLGVGPAIEAVAREIEAR